MRQARTILRHDGRPACKKKILADLTGFIMFFLILIFFMIHVNMNYVHTLLYYIMLAMIHFMNLQIMYALNIVAVYATI